MAYPWPLADEWPLVFGVAAGATAVISGVWRALQPRDHRDRSPAAKLTASGATPACPPRRRPGAHAQRRPVTDHPVASLHAALGSQRTAALVRKYRAECVADLRTRGCTVLYTGHPHWLFTGDEPPQHQRGAVFSVTQYALAAGHLLTAGWNLDIPDDLLLGAVRRMALLRPFLVEGAEHFPADPDDTRSMYDRVGVDGVRLLVDQFYSALCGDPTTGPFFHTVDVARLRRHQARMISQVLGGPVAYTDAELAEAHRYVTADVAGGGAINNRVFARTAAHLLATGWALNAPEDVVLHVAGVLASKRTLIVEASRRGRPVGVPPAG